MIGLIRKDFYTLGRYGRFMLIYLLVFGVLFAGQGSGSFISSMMVVMVTIMSISTFSYDDYAKWDRYAVSTPVSRKKIVLAKYLLVLILVVLGAAAGLLINLIYKFFRPELDLLEASVSVAASSLVGATMTGVTIPFIYKYGTEKSRLVMLVLFAVPTGVIILLSQYMPELDVAAISELTRTLLLCAPLLCIAVVCFSYVAAVRIFIKKEIV